MAIFNRLESRNFLFPSIAFSFGKCGPRAASSNERSARANMKLMNGLCVGPKRSDVEQHAAERRHASDPFSFPIGKMLLDGLTRPLRVMEESVGS
jgi:hypothetical protein